MNLTVAIGSRANWGSLRSACLALRRRKVDVRPVLFASALSERYGDVPASLARDDFKPFASLATHIEGDTTDMSKTAGLAAIEWGTFLRNNLTDGVLVCGDRHEVLGAAMAAAYAGVRTIHTMGGETSGNVDDKVRDAITALAGEDGAHCVATEYAGNRVADLLGQHSSIYYDPSKVRPTDVHTCGNGVIVKFAGKPPQTVRMPMSVYVTGCPRIDTVREVLATRPDPRPMILVSQHPVTTSWRNSHAEMTATLRAVEAVAQRHRLQVELFWPNADAGTGGTHQAIRDWLNSEGGNSVVVRTHRSMGPEEYARMMASCRVMVGNSSSALRDGAWIGTPAVNVGDRQRGREHGANVADCAGDTDALVEALQRQAEHGPFPCSTLYGDGTAGEKVATVICN
jgi:UDP-N-acetylglucosamine 2-epimerase